MLSLPPPQKSPPACPAFQLLKLPRELRDKIYLHALTQRHSITWPAKRNATTLSPALLATCKQVYEEAAPLLYTANGFIFLHPSDCCVFQWTMDHNHARKMSKVTFNIGDRDLRLWGTYLESRDNIRSLTHDLPNLKLLCLRLRQNWWNSNVAPAINLNNWHSRRHIKQLCNLLQQRTAAESVVICTLAIPEVDFMHINERYHKLIEARDGHDAPKTMLMAAVEVHSAKVMLELVVQGR